MLLTVWTKQGRKSIHLPYEALDKVREMVYNNSEHIIEYSVCVCDYEKIERLDNGVVQKDNETEVRSESLLDENG
jgi:ssRNA-specific RNase YbeY (16S rRNA maturation enzyme)